MSMSNIPAAQVVATTQISQDTFAPGYYQQSIKANVPRIYNGSSNQFTPGDQYYGVITGRDDTSHFGRSIDVDFEDHRIVGGGPGYDNGRGYIAVYDWLYSGTPAVGSWNLIGNYINGPDPGGRFGECVSMDYDGQRVIVGAPNSNSGAGAVHVVDYNVNTGNFSITRSIYAGTGVSSFGFSVSIAGDKADRFVVGAPNVNTIYVYEYSIITSTWTETYSNVGTDSAIVNDVPLDCVGTRQTLYPKFNGYGYSVDMSGFGEHIAVGAPGTAVVQLRASGAMGTTTPGPVNHTVGEHAISSTGPHYTGGTGTGTGNMNMEGAPGGSTSNPITQSTSGRNTGGGWSCGSSRLAHNTGASGGHPFSCRKLWNDGMTSLGAGVAEYGADGESNTVPVDSRPYLNGVVGAFPNPNDAGPRDNWFYPNFQTGNVRMLRCPDGGSWSSGVTQVGTVLKGFDNAIVPTVDRNGNTRSAYEIALRSTGLHYFFTNRHGDSLPGFGQTVQISADGSRLTVSAPTEAGHQYFHRAMQGNIYTYSFNKITGNYEDPLKDQDADGKGYEFVHDPTNSLYGMGTSLTEDGSRIFGSCFDHLQFLKVHDFSGKTYFMSSPIIVTHNDAADFYGGTLSSPVVMQTEGKYGDPVPRGYMSGWRTAAKSGKICAVSMPAYPECFGSRDSNDSATSYANIQPNNGKGRGIIFIYRFPLTQVVSGNSLFEGTVKCMDLTIGSTTNSLTPAKLHFGGRLGEANTEQASTIETRWLGQQGALYEQGYSTEYGIFDHELFISKFHGGDPVSTGWPQIRRGHWTRNQWSGSRIRLKAPKIEFQLQHVNAASPYEKYNEHTCVTITNNGSYHYINDSGFGDSATGSYGDGHIGPTQSNNGDNELRQLMCIRTGTCNARVNAGLMLVAARNNSVPQANNNNITGETGNEGRWVPDDGSHYTLAPGNDGWLYLLTETIMLDDAGNLGTAQPESVLAYYDGTGGDSKTVSNSQIRYAGFKVGNLEVMGAYTNPSDDRLKHFEEEIPDCLELINQLNPYKYKKSQKKYTENYIGDVGTENKDWNWEIGLIAQDIKKIPYLEFIVKDPNPSSDDIYSLRYNNFIGVCLQGVKDLHNRHQPELAKVATLQSDLTIEKEKVATLQSDLTVEREKVTTLQSDLTIEKEKVATLQSDLTIEKEKVATLQTDVDREKLKTLNLQERILVMEQAYHALLERVSDLENS